MLPFVKNYRKKTILSLESQYKLKLTMSRANYLLLSYGPLNLTADHVFLFDLVL